MNKLVLNYCAERAIWPLLRDLSSFFASLRCGSGLSGEVLTEQGHHWIGLDISEAMLGTNL